MRGKALSLTHRWPNVFFNQTHSQLDMRAIRKLLVFTVCVRTCVCGFIGNRRGSFDPFKSESGTDPGSLTLFGGLL